MTGHDIVVFIGMCFGGCENVYAYKPANYEHIKNRLVEQGLVEKGSQGQPEITEKGEKYLSTLLSIKPE